MQCDHFEYKVTTQGSLKKHKMLTHEGIKYQCDACEYKAKQKGALKTHTMSVHEGIKYQCDHCESELQRIIRIIRNSNS